MTDRFEPIADRDARFAYRPRAVGQTRRTEPARTTVPVVAATRVPARVEIVAAGGRRDTSGNTAKIVVAGRRRDGTTDRHDRIDDQEQLGRQLLADGSVPEAIVAFRQWAYLSPENPAAHFQLGLALDDADQRPTARRAYRAALTALDRCDPDQLVDVLHGYDSSELRRLLVDRASA